MDDLISRQAAITLPVLPKEYREYQTFNFDDAYEQGWDDLQKCIEELPSAQPEIIRCKDCKYARLTYDGSCKYCDIWFPDEAQYMDGDYYCASAERKEHEGFNQQTGGD